MIGIIDKDKRRKMRRVMQGCQVQHVEKPPLHDFQKDEIVLYTKRCGQSVKPFEARIAIQHKASTAELWIVYWQDNGWRWTRTNYLNLKRKKA